MLGTWRAGRAAVGALVVATMLAACGPVDAPEQVAGATCVGSTNAAGLTNLFDLSPGGMFAADYQRAIPLPDGRTLWLFQDASITLPPPPPPPEPPTPLPGSPPAPPALPLTRLVHNAALIQSGNCFDLLRSGTDDDPRPWLYPGETTPFSHWFWPLDATMGQDGRLYIFVAEMVEHGARYLSTTEPIATRVVAVDLATMTPVAAGFAPDASAALYGFSITSDATWTYLYGQCHRQFGWSPSALLLAHDLSCSANVTVARVPKGAVLQSPTYWDGTTWQPDRSRARAVIPTAGRSVNPTQVRWTGSEFVGVTKVGDWFGTTVFLDRAPAAQGPWTTYARLRVNPKCDPTVCNTYFASWVPFNVSGGQWMIGLSNNRWDGGISDVNRPTFLTVPPPGQFALAARCARVQC